MTLTKEWLRKTIAELEEERDAVPGAVNEDALMALAAMKIALASLEAESVAFRSKLKPPSSIGSEHWDYTDHRQPDAFELESCVIERLFTEPPALVAVPAGYRLQPISEYDAMCSAMLQVAENVESPTTMQTAPALDSSQIIAESPSVNSPVIPDGWVMVPVDATRAMIDAARRVEEDGYDAMHKAMIAAAPQQEVR